MKLRLILSLSLIPLLFSGCALHPPTDKQTVCLQLKRQMNYYESSPSTDAAWVTNGQKDKFKQQLKDNHCE